jgi:dTDP-4-dehydrorhamnose reductase
VPLVALSAPQLDLTVPQSIERAIAAIAPRAIVNAAAYTSVDRAESEPALLRRMIGFKTSARRARADRVGI